MTDEEKKDILFQIDMQLYDEFNDKFCEMNDNLGTIYTYKDIDDLEKLEKEKEIKLLREAIEKQSKKIELLKEENEKYKNPPFFDEDKYTENDKIKAKIEDILNSENSEAIEKLIEWQSLLEKE